jgi:hypothetical protein
MKLRTALLDSPMRISRLMLALSSFTWAILLLLPGDLFASCPIYNVMAQIASENVWGIAFTVHGVVALYTLTNGTRNHVTLLFDGFLGCTLWTASTVACFVAYWPALPFMEALVAYRPPASMSGSIWIAAASWWHLVKHWAEEERAHYDRRCSEPCS